MEFLKRLDTNNNGRLDVDEMQGRAKFLIDRVASQTGLDTSRSISLDQFSKSFEKMRNGGAEEEVVEDDGLLPGFDGFAEMEPLPGFGATDAIFANITVEDRDTRTAEDRMRRYDRDKNGYLSRQEISSGRWSDDPFQFDRNRDGRLSAAELAVRYAKRRIEASGGSVTARRKAAPTYFTLGSTNSSSSNNSSSSGGDSGDGGDDRAKRFIGFIMSRYDRNRDGKIDKNESQGMRNGGDYDKNRDGTIDRAEVESYVSARFGGGDRSKDSSGSDEDQAESYRFSTLEEKLDEKGLLKDLEEYGFLATDSDRDGQVRMAEFSSSWDNETAEAFVAFDSNNDGVITPDEFSAGIENGERWVGGRNRDPSSDNENYASSSRSRSSGGSSRGGYSRGDDRGESRGGFYRRRSSDSSDSSKSSDEDAAEEKPDDETSSPGETATDEETTTQATPAGEAGPPVSVPTAYVRYAVQLIKEHDANKDQVLDKEEWSKMAKSPAKADTNGDGNITAQELAFFKFQGN